MNMIKRAMDMIAGMGTSKSAVRRREWRERWFPAGTQFERAGVSKTNSRQVERRYLCEMKYKELRLTGHERWTAEFQPQTRKARRQLGRALASKMRGYESGKRYAERLNSVGNVGVGRERAR